jgi:hypothetical protein
MKTQNVIRIFFEENSTCPTFELEDHSILKPRKINGRLGWATDEVYNNLEAAFKQVNEVNGNWILWPWPAKKVILAKWWQFWK